MADNATSYPTSIDSFVVATTGGQRNAAPKESDRFNKLQSAMAAVQSELDLAKATLSAIRGSHPAIFLPNAVGYWDVNNYVPGTQVLANQGTGGSALNAVFGSVSGIDVNDPVVLAQGASPYIYLPGFANNYLSVPDSAAVSVTGDIDLPCRVSVADWSVPNRFHCKRGGAQESFDFMANVGVLSFFWSVDGATMAQVNSTTHGLTNGVPCWVRVTRAATSGNIIFYTAPDSVAVPTVWTIISTHNAMAPTGNLFDATSEVQFGAAFSTISNMAGNVHRAIIRNGINGTTVLDIDTSVLISGAQSNFTATTGQLVTINRGAVGRKTVSVVRTVGLLGVDDYLEIPNNALMNFGATDSFTLMTAWRSWGAQANFGVIMGKFTGLTGYRLYAQGTTQETVGVIGDGAQAYTGSGVVVPSGAARLVTMARDVPGDALRLYTDSISASPGSDTTTGSLTTSDPMRILAYCDAEFLFGALFRRPLSAPEVAATALYAQTRML